MTSPIDTLKAEVQQFRAAVKPTHDGRKPAPEGAMLYALNMAWAKTKAAHDAKIKAQREEYEAKRREYLARIEAYDAANPPRRRGRAAYPDYTDAVKIAAARAFTGRNRTEIRLALGTASTATLTRVIQEGQALHDAGEAAQATDGGW